MNLTVEISQADINRIMARLKTIDPTKRSGVAFAMMQNASGLVEQRLKANVSNKILKRRTGFLANSIQSRVGSDFRGITAVIGSGVRSGARAPYANILESGGTIVPVKKQWLTVPTQAALTPSGAPRYPNARRYPGAFLIKTKGGDLLIAKKRGKTGITVLYRLVKSVRIQAKRYMEISLSQMKNRIYQIMNATVSRHLKG